MVRQLPQTRLVVLSGDDQVIDLVRNAAQPGAKVASVRDLQHLMKSPPDGEPDVLIVDGVQLNVAATIEQLTRRFPEAVTIIVGTREESDELMQLAATGQIFRFLLRPLSPGPVRLVLASAIARRSERRGAGRGKERPGNDKSQRKHTATFVTLGVALFMMIGGLWAATTFLAPKKMAPPPVPVALVQEAPPKVDAAQSQLDQAAAALAEGRAVVPGGALELYRSVLAADATNAAALAGVRTIADQQLERAEAALVMENLDEAEQIIALVREVDADHPRLSFLDTQLTRERERRDLREQRVRRLVEAAQTEIQSGNLLGMVSGGAVDALLEARKLAPDDPGVAKGIRDLSQALAEALRKSFSTGDMSRVQAYAAAARRLGTLKQVMAASGLPRNALSRPGRGSDPRSALEPGGQALLGIESESN
jgi:hypothetical protein